MLGRFALAAVAIVVLTAAATATAGLLQVDSVVDRLAGVGGAVEVPQITQAEAGEAQTLLLLGSDRRYEDRQTGRRPRADTQMLVRLDPNGQAIGVLSIPRDLLVRIPGVGERKINDAYAEGGLKLAVETVSKVTGLEINHVVNVNFGGFREAINAVGCVYADVDRRYYNSNVGVPIGQRYDAIDVMPGYDRLCGVEALDYVRYRKGDSDIVRAARQQDFLRAAKDQLSTSSLLGKREELLEIFTSNTQTDADLATSRGLLSLLKLGLFTVEQPVRQVQFPGEPVEEEGISAYEASQEDIWKAVDEFMGFSAYEEEASSGGDPGGSTDGRPDGSPTSSARSGRSLQEAIERDELREARDAGQALADKARAEGGLGFPLAIPAALTPSGEYQGFSVRAPEPAIRRYTIIGPDGRRHPAYRMVVAEDVARGQFYGIQGTTWADPPALANPDKVVMEGGRRLELFRSGGRLRHVAWRTAKGVYWVSNTLDLALSNGRMRTIARSLTAPAGAPAGR